MVGCPSRRRTLALAALLAAAVAALPARAAAADPKARERWIRVAAIGAGIVLYAASEIVGKDAISPDECRWCSSNRLDAAARDLALWDDTDQARRLGNVIGYGLSPVAASALLLVASTEHPAHHWLAYGDDMIAMFEIVWGTQLVTQIVKISAGRQRPYAHYRTGPATLSQEDNLSFFSGHSSLTFSIAVGAGVIAHRRGYRLEPVIWASGLAIAATTAYLRMAADRHYFTDVLVGGAAGALGGAFIPRLTGSMPPRAAVVPQPGGLAVVGSF
jgi:membrane-associated phospholipid phosphatase